jgi:hypothetical protein
VVKKRDDGDSSIVKSLAAQPQRSLEGVKNVKAAIKSAAGLMNSQN